MSNRLAQAFWSAGLSLALTSAAMADDWPQFRGAASNSVARRADFPEHPEKGLATLWQVELPGRGPSSPIVVKDRVFVTASSGILQDRLHLLCFAVADGKLLWERQLWATGRSFVHPTSANAANTPASDGERVFAFFSSNDLAAFDFDGNLLWFRGLGLDYPRAGNDVGMASSPLVIGQTVVVQSEGQGDAFALGLDTRTGATLWRIDRDRVPSWTSPALLPGSGQEPPAVLLQSSKELTCVDPISGQKRWTHAAECQGIPSVCGAGGRVFLPAGGITALKPATAGGAPAVDWTTNQISPGAASPLVSEGKLYVVNRGGVLVVADTTNGQILSKTRLEGSFWATPVLAGNWMVVASQDGNVQLIDFATDGRSAKMAAKVPLGETLQSSPAVANGAVYLRSDKNLWKLGDQPQ